MTFLESLVKTFLPKASSPQPSADVEPIKVGAGGNNETQMTISGEPHLFRDEGDRVAHFVAQFEARLTETPFGPKLLPDLIPHWSLKAVHEGLKVTQVVAQVIQGGAQERRVAQLRHMPQRVRALLGVHDADQIVEECRRGNGRQRDLDRELVHG